MVQLSVQTLYTTTDLYMVFLNTTFPPQNIKIKDVINLLADL